MSLSLLHFKKPLSWLSWLQRLQHKPVACDCRVQTYHAKTWDQSRSHFHGLQNSNDGHCHNIHDDIWSWVQGCNFFLNSSLDQKRSASTPRAKSPLVQVSATPVYSKLHLVMEDHHDALIPEIAPPQDTPVLTHPPPPLLFPDYYAGECLDQNSGLDSKDRQPKRTPDWWSDTDSYGSYCPKYKKSSCIRPPKIMNEEIFLYNLKII